MAVLCTEGGSNSRKQIQKQQEKFECLIKKNLLLSQLWIQVATLVLRWPDEWLHMRKKSKLFRAAITALWTWRRSMHKITTCTQLYSDIILFMLNMTSEISLRKFKRSRIWWARICNVWLLQVKRLCCFWDKKIYLSKLPLKLSKTCDRFVG